MQKNPFILFIALGLLLCFASCKKDDDSNVLSDEEVATTIESSLQTSEGGSALNLDQIALAAQIYSHSAFCGLTKDTSMTVTGPTGRYTLACNWNWMVNCINGVPTNIVYTLSGNSSYTGARVNMVATLAGNATVTNLVTEGNYVLNGSFSRNGSSSIVTNNHTKNFSSSLNINLVNLGLAKSNRAITAGTGTVTLTGAISNGSAFSRTGSLVFHGDGTATLTMDNGKVFTINL